MANATDFLAQLRAANLERVKHFGHGGLEDGWNVAEWGCALGGECGELLNVLKKIRRAAPHDPSYMVLRQQAAEEIADVLTYLDLVAAKLDIDLETVARAKFNEVSHRVGSDVKL